MGFTEVGATAMIVNIGRRNGKQMPALNLAEGRCTLGCARPLAGTSGAAFNEPPPLSSPAPEGGIQRRFEESWVG
jgi:hypothetical protein